MAEHKTNYTYQKTNNKQLSGLKVNIMIVNDSINPLHQNSMSSSAQWLRKLIRKYLKSKRAYTDYLKNRNLNSLLLNPVIESEIEKK